MALTFLPPIHASAEGLTSGLLQKFNPFSFKEGIIPKAVGFTWSDGSLFQDMNPFNDFEIKNPFETLMNNMATKIMELPGKAFNGTIHTLQDLFHALTTFLLKVPEFVYDTEIVRDLFAINGFASLTLLMCGMFYNVIMHIVKGNKLPYSQFFKQAPLIILGSVITPYLFYSVFYATGHIADLLNLLMDHFMGATEGYKPPKVHGFNLLMLLALNIVMILKSIPIFITNAERWFLLLVNIVTAPYYWVSTIYTKKHFKTWVNRNIFLVSAHLINTLVLTLVNILMFGGTVETFNGLMTKMLVILGGLTYWEKMMTYTEKWMPGGKPPRFKFSIFKSPVVEFLTGKTIEKHAKDKIKTFSKKKKP
jgi:hypothetical protein